MKGVFLILLFTGSLTTHSFEYKPRDWDGDNKIDPTEIVLSCSETADLIRGKIATHSFTDPRGQGWYLHSGAGTVVGHIC